LVFLPFKYFLDDEQGFSRRKKIMLTKACRFDRIRKVSSPRASSIADDIICLLSQANEMEYYYSVASQNTGTI
jgi:hypothetical protein